MNRLKTFLKNKSFLLKILFSYFIICVILLSAYSYISIHQYTKRSIENVNRTSETMIYQAYNTADILLLSAYNVFYQFYIKDPDIVTALNDTEYDPVELFEISRKLDQQILVNPLVRSIYIYNPYADLVFFRGTNADSGVMTAETFFDADIIKKIKKIDFYKNKIFIPRKVKFSYLKKSYDENLISIIYSENKNTNNQESMMIVNLDQKLLQQMVTNGKVGDLNQMLIIDNDGTVISDSDPEMIATQMNDREYIKRVLDSGIDEGHFLTSIDGEDSLVTFVRSFRSGWNFIGIGQYKRLVMETNIMQRNLLVTTFVFILIGIIIATLFSANIYLPIYRLLHDMGNKFADSKKQQPMNEYDYLKNTFNRLIDDMTKLKNERDKFRNSGKNEAMLKIIKGEALTEDGMNEIMEKLNPEYSTSSYAILIFKIDNCKRLFLRTGMEKDISIFRFAILNIANEIVGTEFKNAGTESDIDSVCLIVNIPSVGDESNKRLKNLIMSVQSNIEKYMGFGVSAAVGDAVTDLKGICDSFDGALEALEYRLVYGHKSVIFNSEIKTRKANSQEYPYILERQLLDAIRQRNQKKVESHINDFFEIIRLYSVDEIHMSIAQISMMLVRQYKSFAAKYDKLELDYKTLTERLSASDSLDELKGTIEDLCIRMILQSNEVNNDKKEDTVKKIVDYIQNNYHNPSLSIEDISTDAGLSNNYVRLLFNEVIGQSPSGYLTEMRMKKAEELLTDTDYSAKKISEMVGYNNSRYFYTVFKKHSGKTVEEYRKESGR